MERTSVADAPLVSRWVALLLGAVAIALVPWILYLTYTLPSRHVTNHWRLAWTGYDVGLAVALLATAVGVVRGRARVDITAGIASALLFADAWFDIVLARHGGERLEAIAEAAFAELPLALFCLWIAVNAERALGALGMRRRRSAD